MNTLFPTIFWTSAYFLLLAFLYQFLIKPIGNPTFSRFFILGGIGFSLIAGTGMLIRSAGLPFNEMTGVITLPEVVVYASDGLEKSQMQIREFLLSRNGLIYSSLFISLMLLLRFAGSLVYLAAKWKVLRGQKINELFVIPLRGNQTPYSFFHLVFVPERLLGDPALDKVLLHEKAHIRKLHSLDLIFLEILSIFFWFHPAIWFLRREIKMQHEFEADRYVLDRDSDKASYQQILVNFSSQSYCLPITNPLTFSPLKKRIMMMNRPTKNSKLGAILSLSASALLFAGLLLLQSAGLQANQPLVAFDDSSITTQTDVGLLPDAISPPPAPPAPPVPPPAKRVEQEQDVILL